jgi:nuclear pore complex protein Nup133
MFSPRASDGPSTATRSRRRQRTSDTAPQPKAKRQRLPANNDSTIASRISTAQSQDQLDLADARNGKSARLETRQNGIEAHIATAGAPRRELSVRSKKPKPADRTSKGDGSVVLASNSAFIVSKLPALPDRIRGDATGAQHGEIDSASGFGITLTHTHAIVWPYASTSTSPETFVFALPYPSKYPADPLPLGCLVLPSASSNEPGLVVVMPSSGRITYWESISAAATLDFMKQERNGVESSVYGMFSGERVTQITNAESAGFILTFSSGRVAYMSLRDGHGRPAISTQFLRTNVAGTVGGLFGTLRHALSQAPVRGDLAAVRAASSHRIGERDVIALTMKGKLEAWRVHRGGHHESMAEADLRSDIVAAIRSNDPESYDYPEESFEAIDFAIVPRGLDSRYLDMTRLSDAIAFDDASIQHVLMLVGLTKRRATRYVLVEVLVSNHATQIGMVRPIVSYSVPCDQAASVRPRIYLPRPALVAFVVFERAVVVASIAEPPQSPESQLEEDSHMLPATYEDVIDLRDDHVLRIVGSGFEEPPAHVANEEARNHRQRTKNPSVLLMVRGTGVLRVSTTDIDKFADEAAPRVTAKSRLEQAVFFGIKPDNPLVFDRRQQIAFTNDQFVEAALALSNEILASSSPYMSTLPMSIEENLAGRLQALEKLVAHLKLMGVRLDRRSRWALLFNAQKMAVARLLWKRHEHFTNNRPSHDKTTLIGHVVEFIHENQKATPDAARGEVDHVRHWFVNDVGRLDILVAWCYEVIKHLSKENRFDAARLTVLLHEAVNISVCAILAGLEFRKRNMDLYGLEDEDVEFGILRSGYEDTPEPWTSSAVVITRIKKLVELCHKWLQKHHGQPVDAAPRQDAAAAHPDPDVLDEILKEMPQLTDLYLVCLLEASRWNAASSDESAQKTAVDFARAYEKERDTKSMELASLELFSEAAIVAEKHRTWPALALILIDHIHCLVRLAGEPTTSADAVKSLEVETAAERKRIARMLDKHGQPFAFALYDVMLQKEGVQNVLDYPDDKHGYKTKFLRSKPELARVSWINDIDKERDIDHAAETLLTLGLDRETQVWSKKIELSLGKLALLAQAEKPPSAKTGLFSLEPAKGSSSQEDRIELVDRQLGVIGIQGQLHSQVFHEAGAAIDETAELELAMAAHGANLPKKHKVIREIFEDGIKRLINHDVLEPMTLIDLLTLISLKSGQAEEMADPFYLALVAAKYALRGPELELATRLIWRRCFIRDDWAKINDTSMRGDREVTSRLTETAIFQACYACHENEATTEPFRFFSPSEALGAFTESLDRRFAESDKAFCDKVMTAMRAEDTTLRKFIQNNRLDEWAQAAVNESRRAWQQFTDDKTTIGAANGVGTLANGDMDRSEDEVDLLPNNGLVTPPSGNEGMGIGARLRR